MEFNNGTLIMMIMIIVANPHEASDTGQLLYVLYGNWLIQCSWSERTSAIEKHLTGQRERKDPCQRCSLKRGWPGRTPPTRRHLTMQIFGNYLSKTFRYLHCQILEVFMDHQWYLGWSKGRIVTDEIIGNKWSNGLNIYELVCH